MSDGGRPGRLVRMDTGVLFAGVAVADYARAVDWYERLFGRPADVVAHDHESMWRAADGGWVYVVRDEARAGRALVAMAVGDLDAALSELAGRDIRPTSVEPVGESGRKASVTDAEGNVVALLEVG